MKAIRVNEYGSFEQFKYDEVEIPTINDHQILVKVYAASVNHLDLLKTSGAQREQMPLTFPWIPGHDFAGIVERVGSRVPGWEEGDKVYGNCIGGSFAEYLAVDAAYAAKMPDNMTFAEATSVPHVGETAWQALYKHGLLEEGQTVLIQGGGGAVGSFGVQFAKNTGAKVFATAGPQDLAYVESLGADQIVNYKTEDFRQVFTDVDLVLLLVGGDTEEKSYSVLKPGGRLVSTVGIAHEAEARNKQIMSIAMQIEPSGEDLREITGFMEEHKIKSAVGATYFLPDAPTACRVLVGKETAPRQRPGKIVLEINR